MLPLHRQSTLVHTRALLASEPEAQATGDSERTRPFAVRASARYGRRDLWLTILVPAAVCIGSDAARSGAAEIRVHVKTVAEDAIRGELIALSLRDGAAIRTADGRQRRIPLQDIVHLATDMVLSSPPRRAFTLKLTNGDVLYGNLDDGPEEVVTVETIDLGLLHVPLESVAQIDAPRATQSSYRESIEWLDRTGASDDDRILLTNGDLVRGFVTGIGADGIAIEGSLGEMVVPQRLVVAARLASPPSPSPKTPYLIVTFRSSGRLTVTDLDWSGHVVRARLREGQWVSIEAERIARVDVVGGRWEWLSQHRPISYEHTPMLSLGWEYANDRNVLGGAIAVAGETFERGVGVHSRSILTYDLKGEYRRFVTTFGIDDDSGPFADVSVSILVDGRLRFEQSHVRRGKLFDPVRLDITRAKRLELIVDFGDNGDLQDRFNWIEPALIR